MPFPSSCQTRCNNYERKVREVEKTYTERHFHQDVLRTQKGNKAQNVATKPSLQSYQLLTNMIYFIYSLVYG
jgi:hypothetical protein